MTAPALLTGATTAAWGSSWLVTPASAPRWFDSAARSGADVALLDLEDSVTPEAKDTARAVALAWLAQSRRTVGGDAAGPAATAAPLLGLRLNSPGTPHGLRDLLALAESGVRPEVVLVPKVESARDIDLAATHTGGGQRRVWALIETPRGLQQLHHVVRADALAGVVFGAADYAAAAGCHRTPRALWHARSVLAAAAAAADLPAIDSPFFDLDDVDGLAREAAQAAEFGFAGKFAVHPRQLPTIRAAFRPSQADLARARAVVTAADAGGVATLDGEMVGPPMVAAARRALATHTDPGPRQEADRA